MSWLPTLRSMALSCEQGRVDVVWSRTDDGSLVIRWTESGGPHVYAPSHKGFGTRVVDTMIRGLNGKVSLNWRSDGLECGIVLSASETSA
jgi:two-component sensor histidine kinase